MIDAILSIFTQLVENPLAAVDWIRQRPFLVMTVLMIPLMLAAAVRRTFPHLAMVGLLALPFALSFLLLTRPYALFKIGSQNTLTISLQEALVFGSDLIIFLLATVDFFSLPKAKNFSAQRSTGRIASLKQNHRVSLTINNRTSRWFRVQICDDRPQEFDASPRQFIVQLKPRSRSTLRYDLIPSRRGAFSLERVYIRVHSMLGLWQRYIECPAESTVHVYPDMKQLSEYAILARKNRLSLMGVRRTRRIGQDNEFERLRDYTLDDNYKYIDWRTTARRNKLTVKDFQTNQSQRIIFLLDCGRMMTNQTSGLSLLDHSLNAMLMMSYVALQQGDSVGMICFSDQVHTFVPPRGGMKQMNQLLHASFDRFPQLVESRYDQAFLYLSSHCQKRSLVVLISNIIDEVNAHQIQQYLTTLVGRHLPLGVLLREHHLFDAADAPVTSEAALFQAAAAAEILSWRHQVITDLEHQGVLSIDVFPEDMTAPLVNRYLDIKARHLL